MKDTYHKMMRWGALIGILVLMIAGACLPVFGDDKSQTPEEDPEVKLGRENAAEHDKTVKFVTDPAIVERVNRIGQEIAAVANELKVPAIWGSSTVKKFQYTFKVVDDKDVNAYSLPGGFIYVNKGLLDYVHSDDELAGVLAHEVAHAAHSHMVHLIREQNKLQQRLLLPIIIGALISKAPGADIGNLLFAGQLYLVAKVNSYGIEAEKDSDHAAVYYLRKTKYNPVGMLTFMERLARDEMRGPQRELGIFRTHPPSPDRARALLAQLESLKIAISRREVDPTIRAQVTTTTENGVTLAEVKMNKMLITRLADSDGASAEDRAKRFASDVNQLLDDGLQMYEIRLSSDRSRLIARSKVLLTITPSDVEAQKLPAEKIARGALEAIKNLIWQDQFNRIPRSD